jgi:hypothetical protein
VISEREGIAYIAELYRIEADPDHERAVVFMGPASAFVAIGAWQLAMRHPDFSDAHRQLVGALIDQLRVIFRGTPGEVLLGLGDQPEADVPNDCRWPNGEHSPRCRPGGHLGFGGDHD